MSVGKVCCVNQFRAFLICPSKCSILLHGLEKAGCKETAEAFICSQVRKQVAILTHFPFEALNKLRCQARRGCLSWSIVLSLLLTVNAIQAPGQQMQIKKNQLVVLHLGTLVGEMDESGGVPVYRSLIQEVPFIEVHLIQPVPAKRLHRGRMVFSCEEVGIYTGASRKTWTIGKRCKLR